MFGTEDKITDVSGLCHSILNFYTNWGGRIWGHLLATVFSLMILYLIYYYKNKYKIRLSLVSSYIGSLIGFAMLLFSPGNSIRADFGNGLSRVFLFGVISYYWIMCLCIVCGIWVIFVMILKNYAGDDRKQKIISNIIIQSVIFVVASIASAYPLRAKHDALTGLSDITADSTYWINKR